MKRNLPFVFCGLFLGFTVILNAFGASAAGAIAYQVKTDDKFNFECAYAANPKNVASAQNTDPVNTTMVQLDITEASVGTNDNQTHAWGYLYLDVWLVNKGQNWEKAESHILMNLDSYEVDVVDVQKFEDADIGQDIIVDFFSNSPFIIPTPSGLNDSQWNQLKVRLESRLLNAYSETYIATVDKAARSFSVVNVGPEDYSLTLQYGEDGILSSFDLSLRYTNSAGDSQQHILFQVARVLDKSTFPPEDLGFPWEAYLYLAGAIAVVVIIVLIWRKKR